MTRGLIAIACLFGIQSVALACDRYVSADGHVIEFFGAMQLRDEAGRIYNIVGCGTGMPERCAVPVTDGEAFAFLPDDNTIEALGRTYFCAASAADHDARVIYVMWNVKVAACRGISSPLVTPVQCAERDFYLDLLHDMGACANDDRDAGCEFRD